MTDVLRIEALRKQFRVEGATRRRVITAVDGVSFSIARGQSLAVVGESGSGKSTVARIIAGLESPDAGEVSVLGERRTFGGLSRAERPKRARQVQMVFQDPYASLNARLTVEQSIGEALDQHFALSAAERAARVRELLDHVGLGDHFATMRPQRLSGGQRQRVAIARALAVEPQLLILDEAVSALDVSVQAQVINLLADLRTSSDIAYLFVSHDLAVVRQVSDVCVVMHQGRVVEEGKAVDVLDRPQEEYTRRLISSVPKPGWRPQRRLNKNEG